jgi:hypothetical protein
MRHARVLDLLMNGAALAVCNRELRHNGKTMLAKIGDAFSILWYGVAAGIPAAQARDYAKDSSGRRPASIPHSGDAVKKNTSRRLAATKGGRRSRCQPMNKS